MENSKSNSRETHGTSKLRQLCVELMNASLKLRRQLAPWVCVEVLVESDLSLIWVLLLSLFWIWVFELSLFCVFCLTLFVYDFSPVWSLRFVNSGSHFEGRKGGLRVCIPTYSLWGSAGTCSTSLGILYILYLNIPMVNVFCMLAFLLGCMSSDPASVRPSGPVRAKSKGRLSCGMFDAWAHLLNVSACLALDLKGPVWRPGRGDQLHFGRHLLHACAAKLGSCHAHGAHVACGWLRENRLNIGLDMWTTQSSEGL